MNILFVNSICGLFGGVEQVVSQIAVGLRERGHTCDLAFATLGRQLEEFERLFRATYRCANLGIGAESRESATETIAGVIQRTSPDVVFFHNVARLPDLGSASVCPATVRMVHDVSLVCPTGHGYFRHGRRSCAYPLSWRCWVDLGFLGPNPDGPLPLKYVSIAEKRVEIEKNQNLDAIVTVSAYMKSRLVLNGFDPEKITVVAPVSNALKACPTTVPEEPEILFAGSLLRGKGLDLLFKALARLNCPYHLSIIGTGKSEGKLRRLADQLGLRNKITFHGWLPNSSLVEFYEKAKIVVLPVRGPESFCLIGPDAMRHGRPVVAFDVGGITSWLEHGRTGLLVPEQDVVGLTAAIEALLTDTARARDLGAAAAERYRTRFHGSDYVATVEQVLKRIVNAGKK